MGISFIHRELTTEEEICYETINDVYKDSRKTLRLVVSMAAKQYDHLGISTPLVAQMRYMGSNCDDGTMKPLHPPAHGNQQAMSLRLPTDTQRRYDVR